MLCKQDMLFPTENLLLTYVNHHCATTNKALLLTTDAEQEVLIKDDALAKMCSMRPRIPNSPFTRPCTFNLPKITPRAPNNLMLPNICFTTHFEQVFIFIFFSDYLHNIASFRTIVFIIEREEIHGFLWVGLVQSFP